MPDTLKLIAAGVAKGLQDGVLGIFKIHTLDKERKIAPVQRSEPKSTLARRRAEQRKEEGSPVKTITDIEPKVIHRILRCCAWNGGIFWASIMLFNYLLMPFLQYFTESIFYGSSSQNIIWSRLGPIIAWTFSALWVLPLFLLSKVVNGLWFQDIADAAYRQSRGRPLFLHSLSKMIADILFSLLLQGLFLIQGTLASFLPIRGLGDLISLIHFCLLYAVYAFEYKWFNMGWEVHKRLSYVETNWPYFIGFGLPLAVLTALPSSYVMSGCVFSILFPLYIISANEAEPLQQRFCSYPVRLFSPVIHLTNAICTLIMGNKRTVPTTGGPTTSAPSGQSSSPTPANYPPTKSRDR